jgi:hypothetical protein
MLRGIFRGTWKTWSELLFSTFCWSVCVWASSPGRPM